MLIQLTTEDQAIWIQQYRKKVVLAFLERWISF